MALEVFESYRGRCGKGIFLPKDNDHTAFRYFSLTLPKKNDENTKLPVMVWIHGGAFRNGGCDHECYDSDLLA